MSDKKLILKRPPPPPSSGEPVARNARGSDSWKKPGRLFRAGPKAHERIIDKAMEAKKRELKCPAIVRSPRAVTRSEDDSGASICGREGVYLGLCYEHFLRDYLQIAKRQHKFSRFQVPLSQMSERQLKAFTRLPLDWGLEQILEELMKQDPEHPLVANPPRKKR